MTWVRWAIGAMLVAALAWAAWDALRDSAEVDRLKAANATLTRAYAQASARTDAVLRREKLRADSLRAVQSSADTVFQRHAEILRVEVADRLRPHVRGLVHADNVKVAACEGRIRSCERKLDATRRQLATADSLLAVRDTLIGELDGTFLGFLPEPEFGPSATCGYDPFFDAWGCTLGVGVSF